jgi:hypothetical protein
LSNDTTLYELDPLPLENGNATRLLEVVSDNDGGPTSSKPHSASLDDPDLSHTALSYMWGEEDASKEITVNSIHVLVRPNLWGSLNQLR